MVLLPLPAWSWDRSWSADKAASGVAFVENIPELPAVLDQIPECPRNADCRFVPAVYEQTDPSDPNAYGNYDPADRPDDGNEIRYILIHSTESTYDSTINAFGDPSHGASTHYVIRSSDGEITQMVRTDDLAFHAGNWPGTTQICDWSSKALSGRSFALAGKEEEWKAIWHGRTKGWFWDSPGALTEPGNGRLVEPAPGLDSIPVYGLAYPEPEAFPSTIPVQQIQPLQYRIPAGQRYTVTDVLPGQYYYARFDGAEVPDNHTLVVGKRRYVLINFNYRHAYVDLNDVRFVASRG